MRYTVGVIGIDRNGAMVNKVYEGLTLANAERVIALVRQEERLDTCAITLVGE